MWSFADEPIEWCDFISFLPTETSIACTSFKTPERPLKRAHVESPPKKRSPFLKWYDATKDGIDDGIPSGDGSTWKLERIVNPPKRIIKSSENDYSPHSISAIFKNAVPLSVETPPRNPRNEYGIYIKHVDLQAIDVTLRADEAPLLKDYERKWLNKFLEKNLDISENSRESTSFIEHRIKLIQKEPIAVPPYRLSPITTRWN